jgi:predicted enzyme related to lactoylglutathione lyase
MAAPVVHFEIGCQNLEKTRKFYAQLFGWEFHDGGPSTAMVANLGPTASSPTPGIGGHINSLGHPPHQYVTFYIQVPDLDATLAAIETAGGKVCVPKQVVPGMGHFAWFTDPEGNTIGLWQSMMG